MPKNRLLCAPKFRRQMIELVRAGRDPERLAREFEPTAQSFAVAAMARVLNVSTADYYARRERPPSTPARVTARG